LTPSRLGGMIVLDAHGNLAMPFDTSGMHRGSITGDGTVHVAIFEE
jgi:beta-aspartyl-peptidase (threonine type)